MFLDSLESIYKEILFPQSLEWNVVFFPKAPPTPQKSKLTIPLLKNSCKKFKLYNLKF